MVRKKWYAWQAVQCSWCMSCMLSFYSPLTGLPQSIPPATLGWTMTRCGTAGTLRLDQEAYSQTEATPLCTPTTSRYHPCLP
jgi:hypothetical protein